MLTDLIKEYRKSLKVVRKMKERAREDDRPIIARMESDLKWALEWMNTGRMPGNRRGVERLAAYQREKSFDPIIMQKYFADVSSDPYRLIDVEGTDVLTEEERFKIEDAMLYCTDREKEVYLLSRGYCFSFQEIAELLGIEKGSVQKMVERAEQKIAKRLTESLFLVCG